MVIAILATLQMPWTAALPPHGASLDILRPKFDGGGTSLTSVAVFASARMPMGNVSLRVELPFAHIATDPGGSSSSLGNPYVGIETGGATGVSLEAGIRGPLASDTEVAPQLGALADITQIEAFFPNLVTASAGARYRFHDAGGSGFLFDGGGGPAVWFPTEGGDPELVLHHHMMAGYRGADLWVAVGFGGWTAVTSDGGSVGERTVNQAGASFGMAGGKTRPSFHVIVPLDQAFTAATQIVLGIGLAIAAN
ncbi:MAG: hypothetical protein Q8R92_10705 [Deltaproteobacteria bacterium]|nr:hypothetical protein [Deltaproteobacteria bacterium]